MPSLTPEGEGSYGKPHPGQAELFAIAGGRRVLNQYLDVDRGESREEAVQTVLEKLQASEVAVLPLAEASTEVIE